ncbi:MAG TPA: adenylate/guanylate cyclase domain-containing protein, partial [Spirochaetia bacterium]|nr:adenylate/guanylate cyclase domain-containing protein [Spirochaetia bacterium]
MPEFSSFIPQDRRRALAEGRSLDGETTGTALLADISGFTPLSEEYSQEFGAHRGAEEVTLRLNTFFDLMVQTINTHEGTVISFSGDALTCWFDEDEGFRALTCALEIQKTFQQFPKLKTPGGREFELGVKIALANGPARRFLVGEPDIQVMDLMAGDVFQRMARIEQRLEKGEVGTDQQVAAILPELVTEWPIRRTDAGEFLVVFPPGTDLDLGVEPRGEANLPEVPHDLARPWLLGPVFDRIGAGQNSFLADLRIAVVFFLGMESPDFDRHPSAVGTFQKLIAFLQKTLAGYEGNLLQVIVGDKGTYLYGAFGAPVAHENEAGLALHALLAIRDQASQAGLRKFRIGVSQGQIYAGAYGGVTRKTYGVLGNEVNIAARIMQAAPENGILVSPAVYRSSSHQFRFEAVGSKTLKGLAFPMELQKLKEALPKGEVQAPRDRTRWPLVGRDAEMARVEAHLDRLTQGQGGVLLVEGEAGIGKSRFIDEVEYRCRVKGATVFRSGADYIESNTPYF